MTNNEYNKELILAHQFLKQQYETYKRSNQIKSDNERRAYAHAIHTIGDIAYNTTIQPKPNPNNTKRDYVEKHNPMYYNTIYDD